MYHCTYYILVYHAMLDEHSFGMWITKFGQTELEKRKDTDSWVHQLDFNTTFITFSMLQ